MPAEPGAPHDERAVLAAACTALKLFPLPGVVLLPGTATPFHLFEPRYRALGDALLAGDGIVAVPTLVEPEQATAGRARLHPVAGIGRVVASQRNGDGTIDLVIRCLGRVRLLEEVTGATPWREYRAELLDDRLPEGGVAALATEAEALEQLCLELATLLPAESGAGQLAEAATRQRSPGALADLVAAAALGEPKARYKILETVEVGRRLELVVEEVAGVVLLLSRGKAPRA